MDHMDEARLPGIDRDHFLADLHAPNLPPMSYGLVTLGSGGAGGVFFPPLPGGGNSAS
jgi:hypothetical protein